MSGLFVLEVSSFWNLLSVSVVVTEYGVWVSTRSAGITEYQNLGVTSLLLRAFSARSKRFGGLMGNGCYGNYKEHMDCCRKCQPFRRCKKETERIKQEELKKRGEELGTEDIADVRLIDRIRKKVKKEWGGS